MLHFFRRTTSGQPADPHGQEMEQTRERFFIFLDKLEARMTEFANESVPELQELSRTDPDMHKRAYHRLKSAVLGQIESIREKAEGVREEKIAGFPHHTAAYPAFLHACHERFQQFTQLYHRYIRLVQESDQEDLEAAYQAILDEHEAIRNRFACVQCAHPLTIDQVYFITTYLPCPSCQTQNTFEPGTRAKQLEHLGRQLAEQRTAHLLRQYENAGAAAQDLYQQRHELELGIAFDGDPASVRRKKEAAAALRQQQEVLEDSRPALYRQYLRAMFDEWNKINPILREEHERFYQRMLADAKL